MIACWLALSLHAVAVMPIPTPQRMEIAAARRPYQTPIERLDTTLPREGYRIVVTPETVELTGGSPAGLFYAWQTFRQVQPAATNELICLTIEDAPKFALRGFMHDTGRNFQSVDDLKAQLDIFASYKLNTFHWHLTDNPAWRIQSKRFPQITSLKGRVATRDPEKSYTFEEIREVIAYAKARHIQIIPELDMPGHSAFFKPVFGFEMGSPQGIAVLKELITEFCAEIPATDCPYLHIGSDEVRVPDPQGFMQAIESHVIALGRRPVVWAPGLAPARPETVRQLWADGENAKGILQGSHAIIDSAGGYLNLYDPQELVRRHLTHPIPATALGSILCCWPDANVDNVANIVRQNAIYPTLLAFAERTWATEPATPAAFEARLDAHRLAFFADKPFDYIPHLRHRWWCANLRQELHGGSFLFAARGKAGLLPAQVGSVAVLTGEFELKEPRRVSFRIGFESPGRSNRYGGGIPQQGTWDANGGTVLLDGQPLPPPIWKEPGKYRYTFDTWFHAANEIPFTDEEFWWLREPVSVDLPAGKHTLTLKAPLALPKQYWSVTCLPVRLENGRWVDDPTMTISPSR